MNHGALVLCGLLAMSIAGCGRPEPAAPAAVAPPPRRYPAPAPDPDRAANAAFFPQPLVVHRCLSLIADGPPEQVEPVCAAAHALAPWNPEIRAVLAKP